MAQKESIKGTRSIKTDKKDKSVNKTNIKANKNVQIESNKSNKKHKKNVQIENNKSDKNTKNIYSENKPKKDSPKKINSKNKKNKFNLLHIFIAVIILSIILGGAYSLYNFVFREKHTIQLIDVAGVEYGDYTSLTILNGDSFTFTVSVDEDLISYPQFNGVTANGEKLIETDGVYKIENISSDMIIVANGYGTAGFTFENTTLKNGINKAKAVIPYGITHISPGSFISFTSLTEVFIPSSVIKLDSYAFKDCTNLINIDISNNTMVDLDSFSGTAWLNSQPDGVVYAGGSAYSYKGTMINGTTIQIKQDTKSISPSAFKGITSLAGIILPNSVEKIGSLAFYQCSNLANISIGSSIKSIGANAFDDTKWYNNQPNGLIYIENWLYKYKGEIDSLFQASIKATTIGIADSAFYNVYTLTNITIPNGLKYIGIDSFRTCVNLESIVFPETLISIEEYAFSSSGISGEVTLPKSIKYLGSSAFFGCPNLLNVTILEGLTELNSYVFSECSKVEVFNIYADLESIASYAFFPCEATINFYSNSIPKLAPNVFYSLPNLKIFVPEKNVDLFKSADGWNAYSSKIFALEV
ncbi:MAG: leucine-rich repeat domain-containing protein [Clostridia bacterium]|nr:leucine-rich repeat domain-containing protein [Clostridia bacterium]MDD3231894.1 leucine-rich repeat domain-containing protein [Clostridia bacterium]